MACHLMFFYLCGWNLAMAWGTNRHFACLLRYLLIILGRETKAYHTSEDDTATGSVLAFSRICLFKGTARHLGHRAHVLLQTQLHVERKREHRQRLHQIQLPHDQAQPHSAINPNHVLYRPRQAQLCWRGVRQDNIQQQRRLRNEKAGGAEHHPPQQQDDANGDTVHIAKLV